MISIIFLLGFVAFSGYVLYLQNRDKTQIRELDDRIASAREKITAKSDVEVTVRNLDKKYAALQKIFTDRKKYSLLVTEMRTRKPSALEFTNLDVKEGTVGINGIADNYVSIADYINNLLNNKFEGGIAGLDGVFTSVSLNSVNMESSKNQIQFFIVVAYDPKKLK
jgi:Tfp pilus assembly protein PilN